MRLARVAALVLVVVAASGCRTGSTPVATGTAGEPLPTLGGWPLPSNVACGGVELGPSLTLEGSASDGVYALLGGSQHVPTQWPPGYTAQFSPSLQVRNPAGTVVASAGLDLDNDHPTGLFVCTTRTVDNSWLVQLLPG